MNPSFLQTLLQGDNLLTFFEESKKNRESIIPSRITLRFVPCCPPVSVFGSERSLGAPYSLHLSQATVTALIFAN